MDEVGGAALADGENSPAAGDEIGFGCEENPEYPGVTGEGVDPKNEEVLPGAAGVAAA